MGTGKIQGNTEISLIDVIEHVDEDAVERVTREEDISRLEEYVGQALSQREQEIIRMRYGLNGGEEIRRVIDELD